MAVDPSRPGQVGPALLEYLARRLGASDLRFAEPPEPIGVGWETYVYTFSLEDDKLDSAWARPLILRVYPGADQGPKAEREAAVQRFAVERGYPAPRPLAVETDAVALGRPFMIMERAPGVPMLDRMAGNPVAAFRPAGMMADAHVALHRLPVAGFPVPWGDRHHDIASTLVLIRTAPVEVPSLAERLLTRFGRGLVVWRYLRRYR